MASSFSIKLEPKLAKISKSVSDVFCVIISLFSKYESSWMTGNIIRVDGGEDITG